MADVVIIEPYYGGSHKHLLDIIVHGLAEQFTFKLLTLPAKKWHWRARTSALYFSSTVEDVHNYRVLFASSVLNLTELIALRPDLRPLKKVLYFHENQLVYPVRKQKERDFQYGYNQITSCLVADEVLFNSFYNMNSFLDNIPAFFKLQPDYRPKHLVDSIKPKCRVVYFPIQISRPLGVSGSLDEDHNKQNDDVLHICWPHRWEHDKGPEIFFDAISCLLESDVKFQLSVLGEQFSEIPDVFEKFKPKLESDDRCELLNWGFVPRDQFISALSSAHVVVSTALHEFYGVSMLEAATLGAFPLVPQRLSYPELFPKEWTTNQLVKKLKNFCKNPSLTRKQGPMELEKFSWNSLKSQYETVFRTTAHSTTTSQPQSVISAEASSRSTFLGKCVPWCCFIKHFIHKHISPRR